MRPSGARWGTSTARWWPVSTATMTTDSGWGGRRRRAPGSGQTPPPPPPRRCPSAFPPMPSATASPRCTRFHIGARWWRRSAACGSWTTRRQRTPTRPWPPWREWPTPSLSRAIAVTRDRHLRVVHDEARTRSRLLERVRRRAAARTRNPTVVLVLLGATWLLVGIGLIMVLSASSVSSYARYHSSFLFFKRQSLYVAAGGAMLLVTSRIRYRAWQRLAIPLMVASLALLVVVLHPAVGTVAGGSTRWITVGPVTIQPSEIAKLAMVVFTATILTRKWKRLDDALHVALPLLPAVAVVCGLIMLQPDLGTTVIVASTVFVVTFVAGVRLRYLVTSVLVGSMLGAIAIMSNGYMKARFLSFLHPQSDPLNKGYQLI